ncbi:MAG TPA: hypothetical protein V6C95_12415 [Coleofasciculaceae cyanobacterium]
MSCKLLFRDGAVQFISVVVTPIIFRTSVGVLSSSLRVNYWKRSSFYLQLFCRYAANSDAIAVTGTIGDMAIICNIKQRPLLFP